MLAFVWWLEQKIIPCWCFTTWVSSWYSAWNQLTKHLWAQFKCNTPKKVCHFRQLFKCSTPDFVQMYHSEKNCTIAWYTQQISMLIYSVLMLFDYLRELASLIHFINFIALGIFSLYRLTFRNFRVVSLTNPSH